MFSEYHMYIDIFCEIVDFNNIIMSLTTMGIVSLLRKHFFKIFYEVWSFSFRINRKSWQNVSSILAIVIGREHLKFVDIYLTITLREGVKDRRNQSDASESDEHVSCVVPYDHLCYISLLQFTSDCFRNKMKY